MPETAKPARLSSLDIFRGATIAGMLIVNQLPGGENYSPLEHAEWNGWTHTDLIFPFFLFIVGVSITLSFASRRARGDSRTTLWKHTIRRALIIYAIGFFLAAFPFYPGILDRVRIMGVLQRIALVYLLAGTTHLFATRRMRATTIAFLLVAYFLLMRFVPVPGYGVANWTPEGSLAAYLDRALMNGHLWRKMWDPEGLLSTMGAMATCLIGSFVGELFLGERSWESRMKWLLGGAVAGIALGYAWNPWFPINKNLWTSSYVLFTAGYAMAVLAACYWVVDVRGWGRYWSAPFLWLGMNPILAFALSTWMAKMLFIILKVPWQGKAISAAGWAYRSWYLPHFIDERNASLAFAATYMIVWTLAMGWLYRHKFFVRI